MKSYKLVNSREVGSKLSRLDLECEQYSENQPFIIINAGIYRSLCNIDMYSECQAEEITQTDFLALPEPLKVGDWVIAKYKDSYETFVAKIHDINNWQITFYQINGEYNSEELKKLTPEQIEVLGLK